MSEPARRLKTRCPRRGSRDFVVTETFEELVLRRVRGGVLDKEVLDRQAGGLLGVHGTCSRCAHGWAPRDAKGLDNLQEEDGKPVGGQKKGGAQGFDGFVVLWRRSLIYFLLDKSLVLTDNTSIASRTA